MSRGGWKWTELADDTLGILSSNWFVHGEEWDGGDPRISIQGESF